MIGRRARRDAPYHPPRCFGLRREATPQSMAIPHWSWFIRKNDVSWTAAGSEAPRRFRTHENLPKIRKLLARSKAVSRLRLATAPQDDFRHSIVVVSAIASWTAVALYRFSLRTRKWPPTGISLEIYERILDCGGKHWQVALPRHTAFERTIDF